MLSIERFRQIGSEIGRVNLECWKTLLQTVKKGTAFHLVYDLVDETGLNRTTARGSFDRRAWTNVHSSRISCLCLRPVLTKNHYVCEHSRIQLCMCGVQLCVSARVIT